MFTRLLLRDLIIATAVLIAWLLAAPLTAGDGPIADLLGVVLGAGAFVVGHLSHEWGHLVGAFLTRSRVAAPPTLRSPFLFNFDSARNSKRQFLLMSLSGFAVTGVALFVVYGLLPEAWFATRVARGAIAFGASLTLLLEVPLLAVSLASSSIVSKVEVFPVPSGDNA